jgi:hypothetical protein
MLYQQHAHDENELLMNASRDVLAGMLLGANITEGIAI